MSTSDPSNTRVWPLASRIARAFSLTQMMLPSDLGALALESSAVTKQAVHALRVPGVHVVAGRVPAQLPQQLLGRIKAQDPGHRGVHVQEATAGQASVDAFGSCQVQRPVMEFVRAGGIDVLAIWQEMHEAEQQALAVLADELHADVAGADAAVGAGQAHGHLHHAQVGPEVGPDAGAELGIGPQPDFDWKPVCHLVATVAGATLEGTVDAQKHAVAGAKHGDHAFGRLERLDKAHPFPR
jgi:hypothetical protein